MAGVQLCYNAAMVPITPEAAYCTRRTHFTYLKDNGAQDADVISYTLSSINHPVPQIELRILPQCRICQCDRRCSPANTPMSTGRRKLKKKTESSWQIARIASRVWNKLTFPQVSGTHYELSRLEPPQRKWLQYRHSHQNDHVTEEIKSNVLSAVKRGFDW